MVILEGLLRSGVGKTSLSQIVVVGDQAAELASFHANRVQLVFVVLRKRSATPKPNEEWNSYHIWFLNVSIRLKNLMLKSNLTYNNTQSVWFNIPRGSLFQQGIVAEEDADVVEDLVEFSGRRMKYKIGGYANLNALTLLSFCF